MRPGGGTPTHAPFDSASNGSRGAVVVEFWSHGEHGWMSALLQREERRGERRRRRLRWSCDTPRRPARGRSAKHCALIGSSGRPAGSPLRGAEPAAQAPRNVYLSMAESRHSWLALQLAPASQACAESIRVPCSVPPTGEGRGRVAWWASIGTPARRDRGRGGGAGTHGPGGSTAGRVATGRSSMKTTKGVSQCPRRSLNEW